MEGLDLNALPHGHEVGGRIAAMGIELLRWNMAACLQVHTNVAASESALKLGKQLATDTASLEIWRDEHLS
jgi:hypothetical protein